MLRAYIDESGLPDLQSLCVVAGYLGTEEQWARFDVEWKNALGQRPALHMNDLRFNQKPGRIRGLLDRLGKVPDACGLERLLGIVRAQDYDDLVPVIPIIEQMTSPYMMAVQPLLFQTMRHVQEHEHVEFFLERQDRYSQFAAMHERFYGERFKDSNGKSRVTVSYLPSNATPRFQAADYLAFAIAHNDTDQRSVKAQLTQPILGDYMMIGAAVRKEQIRGIVTNAHAMMEQDDPVLGIAIKNALHVKKSVQDLIERSYKQAAALRMKREAKAP